MCCCKQTGMINSYPYEPIFDEFLRQSEDENFSFQFKFKFEVNKV